MVIVCDHGIVWLRRDGAGIKGCGAASTTANGNANAWSLYVPDTKRPIVYKYIKFPRQELDLGSRGTNETP